MASDAAIEIRAFMFFGPSRIDGEQLSAPTGVIERKLARD
jgi:hypothetical protein